MSSDNTGVITAALHWQERSDETSRIETDPQTAEEIGELVDHINDEFDCETDVFTEKDLLRLSTKLLTGEVGTVRVGDEDYKHAGRLVQHVREWTPPEEGGGAQQSSLSSTPTE